MNIGTVMKLYTKAQHTEQIHNNNGQDFTQHKEAVWASEDAGLLSSGWVLCNWSAEMVMVGDGLVSCPASPHCTVRTNPQQRFCLNGTLPFLQVNWFMAQDLTKQLETVSKLFKVWVKHAILQMEWKKEEDF